MSAAGIRLGLCLLRYGPQSGMPIAYYCRQRHIGTDPRSANSGKSSSCGISTLAGRRQRKTFAVELSELDEEMQKAEAIKHFQCFIADSGLVNNILYGLDPWDHRTTPVIMECNPGPGVLTRALLDAGCNVVALENNLDFLPGLKHLEQNAGGQLRAVHCDFFKLDPWSGGIVQAPTMFSSELMQQLNIREVPWDSEIPFKVFGILNHRKERHMLWRHLYWLYERLSIYRYGRIELNLFMSEAMYKCITTKPGNFRQYQALPVLCNAAFDVQLLCKEHISSFFMPKNVKMPKTVKSWETSGDHLCLVRLTPRRDLFSERFTPLKGQMFINMVKQCLVKRKSRLLERLDSWNPGGGEHILQCLHLPEDTKAGNIYPEEYKLLFEILTHSDEFNQSFMFDVYEEMACSAF